MTVRTRIAPSPTGDPHVGTAYIALFNLCFARQHNGRFVLRIEDTDRARSTAESEQAIFNALRWLGLDWDEGPDVGGDYGPYRQSERGETYQRHARQLLDAGKAFRCYRTPQELEQLRSDLAARNENRALKRADLELRSDEIARREAAGAAFVVRMEVPEKGKVVVHDMLRGEIELDWANVDAQVLLKSDGMPTYHLANVVDDHAMQISHVIRGEEWINSAPKHKLLYEYFGWDMPELCHLPLLRNPDKSKLSKRRNPTGIRYYEQAGFLPEALLNYLGRMGWSMPDEREKFTLQEMLDAFDIRRVSLGGPIFDVEKLKWLNGLWMRESLNTEQLADRLAAWKLNRDNLLKVLPLVQPRMETLADFVPKTAFLAAGELPLQPAMFEALALPTGQQLEVLQYSLWSIDSMAAWERDALYETHKALAQGMEIKLRDFLAPLFVAISGSTSSFSVMDAMLLLGPELSRARIRQAIEVLGGVSKKCAKKFEKQFRALQSQTEQAT